MWLRVHLYHSLCTAGCQGASSKTLENAWTPVSRCSTFRSPSELNTHAHASGIHLRIALIFFRRLVALWQTRCPHDFVYSVQPPPPCDECLTRTRNRPWGSRGHMTENQ